MILTDIISEINWLKKPLFVTLFENHVNRRTGLLGIGGEEFALTLNGVIQH